MKKLLSASRPLGVINPPLRVVLGGLHHPGTYFYTTYRPIRKTKPVLAPRAAHDEPNRVVHLFSLAEERDRTP